MMTTKTWLRGGGGRPLEAGFFLPELFWGDFQNQASGIKQAGQFFLPKIFSKIRSCSRGGSPHPSLSSKSTEKQQGGKIPGGKLRHLSPSGGKSAGKQSSFSQSCARPSSGLSVEVSKGHRQGSSRHSSHGAGRPSSQMSSRLSVSRFFIDVSKVPSVVLCCSSLWVPAKNQVLRFSGLL